MDPITTSALISAGSSILGGLFGSSDNKKAAKAQAEADERNAALQREFAQNAIQWKVADAEKAGIHKLYALGAQTNPGMASYMSPQLPVSNPMGNAIADAGNGLARAATAGQTTMQRLQERLLETQIDGQEIENAAKRSTMALKGGAQITPPFPSSGFDDNSMTAQTMMAGHGYNRPIINPDLSQSREDMPSEIVRQLFEDMIINPAILTGKYFKQEYNRWKGR